MVDESDLKSRRDGDQKLAKEMNAMASGLLSGKEVDKHLDCIAKCFEKRRASSSRMEALGEAMSGVLVVGQRASAAASKRLGSSELNDTVKRLKAEADTEEE
jgi:hypothetical protein